MESGQKIGLIGIGSMGYHFANRFLDKGHEIVMYDKNQQALDEFKGRKGVSVGHSPMDVANEAEIVFVSLPTPAVIQEVALGNEGIIHGAKVRTYIDLSTTGQTTAVKVGEQLADKGIAVLDAPVSGGVPGAQQGTLAIMVSGAEENFKKIEPLFQIIGKNIFYIGEKIGQAQVMKLANNLLSATAMAITTEAVVLGTKAGIDPERMISVFNASSGRNTATTDKFPRAVLNRSFDYGFKTGLMYKDVKLCLELAEDLQMPMWLGSSVKQFWNYIMTQGGGEKDFTTIIEYIEQMAEIER